MSAYRSTTIGGETLYATKIPRGSYQIRIGPGDFTYDRMIVVTPRKGGRELFLQGWIGELPPRSHWRAAAAAWFPGAAEATWDRREADGTTRHVRVSI